MRREARLGQRIAADRPFVLAQVHHAVEHEMAYTVADVALRRTDAGNMGDRDGRVGDAIADELAPLLKLTPEQKRAQLAQYRERIALDGLESAVPPASLGEGI